MRQSTRCRYSAAVIVLILGLPNWTGALCEAQTHERGTTQSFTVDDMLDGVNLGASDLSDDGRWLAVTTSTLRDRIGVDNYRFGDPTYAAPQKADLLVIETQTGKIQRVFPDKQQLRSIRWSPDATKLAMLVLNGEMFTPVIWDRTAGKTTAVEVPAGDYAAETAELRWSPDGASLLIPLRSTEWLKKEKARFEYETRGPIVVHSSKEPFLAWEELRRMTLTKRLASYDLGSHSFREIVPETGLSSYNISEDGSFITWLQDVTRKTDYDFIGGSD